MALQVNLNPTQPCNDKSDSSSLRGGHHGGTATSPHLSAEEPASLKDLPTELIHEISKRLHPVDRVCLALTCKSLARAIVSAPRLGPANWSVFSDHRFDWLPPESFTLLLRLAHGWIPKDRLRYCWKCHKIMPREEAFFRKRLTFKKNPRWSVKVGLPKEEWERMRKKDRYKHIIQTWCTSPAEDSSGLYCHACREVHLEAGGTWHRTHPVECPTCLEKELTYTWRGSHRPGFRRWLCDCIILSCRPVVCAIELIAGFLLLCCCETVSFIYAQGCRCCRAIR